MNVTYVLQGEPSLLVSIATTTVSQVARLAVCAVMFDVRPTCFKSFVVEPAHPRHCCHSHPSRQGWTKVSEVGTQDECDICVAR